MKKQRWPGDDESIKQEFSHSKREEQMGMDDANKNHGNDYLALGMTKKMDPYQMGELESSWATQLDTVGMQPHAREYLERDATSQRSARKMYCIDGQTIDYVDGIHFGDTP